MRAVSQSCLVSRVICEVVGENVMLIVVRVDELVGIIRVVVVLGA